MNITVDRDLRAVLQLVLLIDPPQEFAWPLLTVGKYIVHSICRNSLVGSRDDERAARADIVTCNKHNLQ